MVLARKKAAKANGAAPFWESPRGWVRLYQGDVREALALLPARSVHCVVTSPPYWGLRSYLADGHEHKGLEIGSEPSPDCGTHGQAGCGGCFVCTMVAVFREVRRVLRDDGTLWLNLGDTYASGNCGGVPWRVALALQADGWVLRQDIIWCLSGGTWLYVRSQKGDMPMMVRDLARLDPSTVKLWNGWNWVQLLGMNCSTREGDELEVVLRSGERISCTTSHKFPSTRGLVEARDLKAGDRLNSVRLPEPEVVADSEHVGLDAAWFAGLYLAEGCGVDAGKIQIAGHSKEIERWLRVKKIVESYGGDCTLTTSGNNQSIRVYGKVICALVKQLVSGHDAKNKCFSPTVWRYSNKFVESFMNGYLSGDGHRDEGNDRWRLGFARNYNLERDFRTACARLGWLLTLNPSFAECEGRKFPTFRGEIRTSRRSGHWNEKDRCEVVEVRRARCREVYDIGVDGEPHLFALASGILTHNSKPSPMPESVRNRCTKAHEYVFLLTKSNRYFYDAEAIREPHKEPWRAESGWEGSGTKGSATVENGANQGFGLHDGSGKMFRQYNPNGCNKRSVWTVASQGFPGAHFATFPPNLIRPMILASTSERGCCASCGAPWRRVVEERVLRRDRPNEYVKRVPGELTMMQGGYDAPGGGGAHSASRGVNTCANSVAGVEVSTIGWEPTCECPRLGPHGEAVPCVVLDPFVGSGTVLEVAAEEGRRSVGIDLSADYLRKFAVRRAEEALKRLRDPGTGLWVIDGHARPVVEAPSARGPSSVRRIV
jgi:hypothetical protein